MEYLVFLGAFALMLPACIYGLRHVSRVEQELYGRDFSDEFLTVPKWPSRAQRVMALSGAFIGGIVISISGIVVLSLLATGILHYD